MSARDKFIEQMMQTLDLPRETVEKAVANLEAKGLVEYREEDDTLSPNVERVVELYGDKPEELYGDIPWKDAPEGPYTYTRTKH